MIKLNILNLIRQNLPSFKRQQNRINLIRSLLEPLCHSWDNFTPWCDHQRMLANVYGSKGVLEGFLRAKYANGNIMIVLIDSTLPRISLRYEGRMKRIGLRDEVSKLSTTLRSELTGDDMDVNFMVYVPDSVDSGSVIADIERFKPHFATYKIVINK